MPQHDHAQHRQQLQQCGDHLQTTTTARAGQIDRHKGPQQNQGDASRGQGLQSRQYFTQIADHAGGDGGIGDPQTDPVAPQRNESGQLAEFVADVVIRPIGTRHHPRQSRKHQSDQQTAHHRDQPADARIEAVRCQ